MHVQQFYLCQSLWWGSERDPGKRDVVGASGLLLLQSGYRKESKTAGSSGTPSSLYI